MPINMDGPNLKLKRADYHIKNIEDIFRHDVARNEKTLRSKKNNRQTDFIIHNPTETAVIIGDAVHNMRVSLDHAYWIAVEANGGVFHRNVKFPFGGNEVSIRASLNGHSERHRPSDEVIDFIIEEVEPFPGGKLGLYELHTLDITDKHQMLLPSLASLEITKERPLVLRTRDGTAYRTIMGPEQGVARLVFSGNGEAGLSVGPGLHLDYKGNFQDAISILFGEGPMEKRAILPTLRMLHQNVAGVLKSLAALLD